MKKHFNVLSIVLAVTLASASIALAGCNSPRSHNNEGRHTIAAQESDAGAQSVADGDSFEDSRWPTTDAELLALPEEQRWYNAWDAVDSYCTISGPVVDVTRTPTIAGETIFISIGEPYPSENSVELPIWTPDDQERFADMIADFEEKPNCWITVTGYLTTYSGHLQFDANSGVDCEWKSGVE